MQAAKIPSFYEALEAFLNMLIKHIFLVKFFYNFFFFTYIKISKDLSAKYYQNNKERLQKKFHEKYWSLSKGENGGKWYKNFSEDERQNLVEYRKEYYKMRKNENASQIKTNWCFSKKTF